MMISIWENNLSNKLTSIFIFLVVFLVNRILPKLREQFVENWKTRMLRASDHSNTGQLLLQAQQILIGEAYNWL